MSTQETDDECCYTGMSAKTKDLKREPDPAKCWVPCYTNSTLGCRPFFQKCEEKS